MEATPQQKAIWSEIKDGQTHLIVEARAGTGKTFTLVKAAELLPKESKVLFAAFNKHIEKELSSRLPKTCKVATLHSFGYRQIRNACENKNLKIDNKKVKKIITQLQIPDSNKQVHSALIRLVSLCKAFLYKGGEEEYEKLRYLVKRFEVEMPADELLVFPHIHTILEQCGIKTWEESVIDFDDMVWLPAAYSMPVDAYEYVFVDEAQDLNYSQQELIFKSCPTGRMVFVGDRYQSIYGFRGADAEAINTLEKNLSERERSVKSLSLTVTFRCPKSHVALARELVPDIEAAPNAKKGQITWMSKMEDAVNQMKEGDMVICRTNAPLVEITQMLTKQGKKVLLSGEGFKDDLLKTVLKLHADDLDDFIRQLEEYRNAYSQQLEGSHAAAQVQFLDMCDSLVALRNQSETVEELKKKIETMFTEIDDETDTSKSVLLSSVHRVKGLEKDRVFIIRSDLMPHPKASEDWQLQQEKNLAYVAVTRAKEELILVGEVSKLFPR